MTTQPPVVIGLTTEVLDAPWYEGPRRYQLFTNYAFCLRQAGAVPLLIPGDTPTNDIPLLLKHLDGILLTGGDDFDLSRLGGQKPSQECKIIPQSQQSLNLSLVKELCSKNMPMLGICLGMQSIGIAHGAELIQHLSNASLHTEGKKHNINIEPETKIAKLVKTTSFTVPSYHHQALQTPGKGFKPSAWSEDGVLEAIENPKLQFAIAVQWHPEKDPESPQTKSLFTGLVSAAAQYRERKNDFL